MRCRGFLWIGKVILRVHGKYFEIGERVFPVEAAALKIHIDLGTCREPEL
jgi:hypothetical protein